MVYKALYREWRPKNFEEMVGQRHITKVLKNQIENNKTGHAYLFCGTRGTGKTSAAKILAMGVNCLSQEKKPCGVCENCVSIQNEKSMDVIEMDAASNNGVDNIRELKESIQYPPVTGRYKVYIIDEVHMLSTGAFNALLKTLEEPPEYIKFILATTEVHKLPATILSRCQRFDFKRISEEDIAFRMEQICNELSVKVDKKALMLIARNAEGSARDALSILDQCLPFDNQPITIEDVTEVLGVVRDEFLIDMADSIMMGKADDVIRLTQEMVTQGKDIHQFVKDLIYFYRNLLMIKVAGDLDKIIPMSQENIERLRHQADKMTTHAIRNALLELSSTSSLARYSSQPRILLEIALIKLATPETNDSAEGLLERIEKLEALIKDRIPSKVYVKKEVPSSLSNQDDMHKGDIPDTKKIKMEGKNVTSFSNQAEYKTIWKNVIAKAKKTSPSASIVEEGVHIIAMDGGKISIYGETEVKREYLIHNKELIQNIFQEISGTKVTIQFHEKKSLPEQSSANDSFVKKELEDFFGTDKVNIIE